MHSGHEAGVALAGQRPHLLSDVLREQRYLIPLVAIYIAAVYATASSLNRAEDVTLLSYLSPDIVPFYVGYLLLFFFGHLFYVMAIVRPDRLILYILSDLWHNYLTVRRFATALPVAVFVPAFLSAFTSFKSMIPAINPFSWDVEFAAWDWLLHGGNHPWQLLQPLLGYPLATQIINIVYLTWFFLLHGTLFWQAFSLKNPMLRQQFFLTFVLAWVLLGSLGAVMFSSAGPCYFGLVTGLDDPYRALMDYLRSVEQTAGLPVTLAAQAGLWGAYEAAGTAPFAGISAMPSMHLAISALVTLLCWRTHRLLGTAMIVYTLLILLGSVHLAWHYAVDGYLAIAGVWIIWIVVGRILASGKTA